MPVVKTLLEKLSSAFYYSTVLPDLPPLSSGPAFFENFRTYCKSDEWTIFMDKRVSKKNFLKKQTVAAILKHHVTYCLQVKYKMKIVLVFHLLISIFIPVIVETIRYEFL